MNNPSYPSEIILYGGTGQAKVVKPIVEYYGSKVIAVIDDTPDLESPFQNVPIFCGLKSFISSYKDKTINHLGFVIAIGNPNGNIRIMLHNKLQDFVISIFSVIFTIFLFMGIPYFLTELSLKSQVLFDRELTSHPEDGCSKSLPSQQNTYNRLDPAGL